MPQSGIDDALVDVGDPRRHLGLCGSLVPGRARVQVSTRDESRSPFGPALTVRSLRQQPVPDAADRRRDAWHGPHGVHVQHVLAGAGADSHYGADPGHARDRVSIRRRWAPAVRSAGAARQGPPAQRLSAGWPQRGAHVGREEGAANRRHGGRAGAAHGFRVVAHARGRTTPPPPGAAGGQGAAHDGAAAGPAGAPVPTLRPPARAVARVACASAARAPAQ